MTDRVLQTVPLGSHWATVDPFLFCAHHRDTYPAGNARLGPVADLEGRALGADFSGLGGWSMYHGRRVPGFPQHPHRGFETVTYVRSGLVDHSDSLGATARFGRGDVQWMTAGSGIVHAEMFPLVERDGPNPLELFQIWLNLPAVDKLVEPHFSMLWAHDIPTLRVVGDDGAAAEVTVIAGGLGGLEPPPPPPSSWAARAESDVAIWHIHLDAGARWSLPPAHRVDTVRTVYLFDGAGVGLEGHDVPASTGAVVACDVEVELAATRGPAELVVLQGRPIGEPVAQHGPFVLNDRAGIEAAFADYRRTGFGGWPWPVDDPVHAAGHGRFARHADGRCERPVGVGAR